jgi:peptidyl-tRNA hydrolase
MSNPTEYIQPIMLLVDKSDPADEADAIRAVALASVRIYAVDRAYGNAHLPMWTEWLAGPFAKSVRRADPSTFRKALDQLDPNDCVHVTVGTAQAVAYRPVRATEMPKPLKRLQVSGTELTRDAKEAPVNAGPTIVLNDSLGMSTGKAAAQAAHALFLWFLHQNPDTVRGDANIRFLPEAEFTALIASSGSQHVIEDAGRTEIEPGSVTAFAI